MKLVILWAVIALAACAHARTATKTQPISAHITSLTDKDNRQKAKVHPAFANAGRQAGVELWRIENFEPVPVPQKDFGKFYKGDSYIVLKTTSDKRNNLAWDIHYWIGSESSQDESGAAAILTVGLDDKFDGKAVQHRETMGHESAKFTGYFQPAIRYLDGGHASGFNHVTTNAGAEKRLFQIKGKKNVRVRQVEPQIASMNKGDCFILDINQDIYVYVGEKAGRVEKLKATSVANQIRDQDHRGRGRVEIIDQYSSEVDVQKFFTALGSGSRDIVPDESAGGDDQAFERSEEQAVTLSEISDSTGSLKITPLPKPLKQEQLKPQESYILDTVSGSIYVWVGKQSTEKEKTEAMTKAQQYLNAKNYPSWVHVARIPQGTEPAAFKQYFATWQDAGMKHSRIVRSLSHFYSNDDVLAQIQARHMDDATEEADQEDNTAVLWNRLGGESASMQRGAQRNSLGKRIEVEPRLFDANLKHDNNVAFEEITDFRQKDLDQDDVFVLDTGDEIYLWVGKETTNRMRKSAQLIAEAYLRSHPDFKGTVVIAKQGLEPETFTRLFDDWDSHMWLKQQQDNEDEIDNEIDVDK